MSDNNPYYRPEKLGLSIICEIEWDNEPYQFNQTILWKHLDTGKFYIATDAGCSCPSPFECYDDLDELTEVESVWELEEFLDDNNEYEVERYPDLKIDMIRRAKEAGMPMRKEEPMIEQPELFESTPEEVVQRAEADMHEAHRILTEATQHAQRCQAAFNQQQNLYVQALQNYYNHNAVEGDNE